ncbi:hypothetical protein GCM10010116_56630 [Microbispora rosea subsp. aerata]|nr:hypothetical protein [Microbispora rosea]GGO28246.1 hypothetical protein GCM10010116_56630 [Microbispora rosea subsp. aerata]GIH58741.1 hypothetical protein Mro02_56550 [Microbispora rosea subsp. aerata]GLJ82454.1 hypothetical protein GCM10017588_11790 [Microbispora rosea subsp. aerata]
MCADGVHRVVAQGEPQRRIVVVEDLEDRPCGLGRVSGWLPSVRSTNARVAPADTR